MERGSRSRCGAALEVPDGGAPLRAGGGSREKTWSLTPTEFLRRFLLHLLPPRFFEIRHYGLLAPGNVNTRLLRAQALLGPAPPDPESTDPPSERHAGTIRQTDRSTAAGEVAAVRSLRLLASSPSLNFHRRMRRSIEHARDLSASPAPSRPTPRLTPECRPAPPPILPIRRR